MHIVAGISHIYKKNGSIVMSHEEIAKIESSITRTRGPF